MPMQNDKSGQNSSQQQKHTQSELETIIRQSKFGSQSDANASLQQYGLSAQLKTDGTAEIFEGSSRVATVRLQGTGKDQQGISSIDY